jgi:hypothetical protein
VLNGETCSSDEAAGASPASDRLGRTGINGLLGILGFVERVGIGGAAPSSGCTRLSGSIADMTGLSGARRYSTLFGKLGRLSPFGSVTANVTGAGGGG